MTQVIEKSIPTSIADVKDHPKFKWSCQTTNILDDQHIDWSLVRDDKHAWSIDAFNYGNEMHMLNLGIDFFEGRVFVDELIGDVTMTDTVLHKGSIKHMSHRVDGEVLDDTIGDLYLKISALANMHFNKYSGYICFISRGRNIHAISLFIEPEVLDMYPVTWASNLNNIYNGRGWK